MKSSKSMALMIISLCIMNVFCNEFLNKMDKVGVSTNTEALKKGGVAVSYSLAKTKTDQFYVQNQNGYKKPDYVNKVGQSKPMKPEVATIEEIPSTGDYYDGSTKLKIETASCNQYVTKREACMDQPNCGWCFSSSSCVAGNNLGPLAPCMRGSFEFSEPAANWNPLDTEKVNISRKQVGMAQLTNIDRK